ncbi:AraC-like DNA-binding protein [Atlantibacter sp. RC6]|nr:AraC-like DNA-binding protein [Atlantibacter sp. RC6]
MSHPEIISTLIEWIDEHIDQPLNIDVVAKKSGYSKWYLQRMFRTVMRQSLGEYIRQRRLSMAAEALRNTRRPIFDIAMDHGYVSQQTFSRVFRREYDITPTDYRLQTRVAGLASRNNVLTSASYTQLMSS